MRVIISIICLLLTGSLLAQTINKAEYFFDTDPGVGNGINIPVSSTGAMVNLSEVFDFSGLSVGYHSVSVRVRDDSGLWSHQQARRFYHEPVPATTSTSYNIIAAEYFFDGNDPGQGMAIAIPISQPTDMLTMVNSIDIAGQGLSVGEHSISIRFKSDFGFWGTEETRPFEICPANTPIADFGYSLVNGELTVSDQSQNASNYVYDFGDSNTNTIANPVHTYALTGTFTLCQIVNNTCGSDTLCVQIEHNNIAPTISNPIADLTRFENSGIYTVVSDLNTVFTDSNNDDLAFIATSSNPTQVIVEIQGNSLNITPAANFNGIVTITVEASDGVLQVTNQFMVTITPVNDPPTVLNPIADYIQVSNTGPWTIATLTNTFTDLDGDNLSFISNSDNPDIIATITNEELVLSSTANSVGIGEIIVIASDGFLSVNDTFTMTINAINIPPTAGINGLENQEIEEDAGSTTLFANLDDFITDPEGDAFTYSIDAGQYTSHFTLTGNELQVEMPLNYFGNFTINILADDGQDIATIPFLLTVNAVNDAPVLDNPISDKIYNQNSGSHLIVSDLNTVFSDIENTTLSFFVNSSNSEVVVSINNNTLSVLSPSNFIGFSDIILNATDGNSTTQNEFRITYTPISTAVDITSGEYFFDGDPGIGNGIPFDFPFYDENVALTSIIDTSGLSIGYHNIGIRVRTENNTWSHLQGRRFYIEGEIIPPVTPIPTDIVFGEYWFDTDPGIGYGVPFEFPTQGENVNWADIFDTSGLGTGYHQVGIRVRTEDNIWSHGQGRRFYIEEETTPPIPTNIIAAEYFFDGNDPGWGMATAIDINNPAETLEILDSISIAAQNLSIGQHTISIRFKSDFGLWGAEETRPFEICPLDAPTAYFEHSLVNGELTITDQSQNAVNYNYDFGDTNTSTISNPIHTYSATGTLTVCQTVSNTCGIDTFCVLIEYNNIAPIVSNPIPDVTRAEDSGVYTVVSDLNTVFTDSNMDELTFTATASDTTEVTVELQENSLNITPALNFNGNVIITIVASDGVLQVSHPFTVHITPVNDAPIVLNALSNKTRVSNTGPWTIASLTDATFFDVDGDNLSFAVSSDNSDIMITANNNELTLSSTTNYVGTGEMIVTASDGILSVSDTFTITITGANAGPMVGVEGLENQEIEEDAGLTTLFVDLSAVIVDPEEDVVTYSIDAGQYTSYFTLTGNELQVDMPAHYFGNFTVNILADDGQTAANFSFLLTVNSVNDAPILDNPISDKEYNENSGTHIIVSDLTNVFSDIENTPLTFFTTSSNSDIMLTLANNTLSVNTPTDFVGFSDIVLSATDGNLTTTDTFKITYIHIVEPTDITFGEYYFDVDPGIGNGIPFEFSFQDEDVALTSIIDTSGLSLGYHNVGIRVKTQNNAWSHAQARRFHIEGEIIPPVVNPPADIVLGEYWFDTDPGVGKGIPFEFPTQGTAVSWSDIFDASGLNPGYHKVGLRVRTDDYVWSHVQGRQFYIEEEAIPPVPTNIIAAEYFFDGNDPGQGMAIAIPIAQPADMIAMTTSINLAGQGLSVGQHSISIRFKSDLGFWGAEETRPFEICPADAPIADFGYSLVDGELTVSDQSQNASNYVYDFGDSNTSTIANPIHTYALTGTFTLCQIVNNTCGSDTLCVQIEHNNIAPTISNPIADLTRFEDSGIYTVVSDLNTVFTDSNNDDLAFIATSSNPTQVIVEIQGNSLNITPAANFNGASTITVEASDGALQVSTQFTVTITPVNDAPTVLNPIIDYIRISNTSPWTIAILTNTFTDLDGDNLSFTSNSDNLDIVPSIINDELVLSSTANYAGTGEIILTASDEFLSVNDTFTMTINSMNTPPTAGVNGLEDKEIEEDAGLTTLFTDLNDFITDPEGDAFTYSIDAGIHTNHFTLTGNELQVEMPANYYGNSTVNILADDGQDIATIPFLLTVNAVNDAPVLDNPISDKVYNQNSGSHVVGSDLNNVFSDIENTTLTFFALSSNSNVMLSIDNNALSVVSPTGFTGFSDITILASDGSLTTKDEFRITYIPIFTSIDITVGEYWFDTDPGIGNGTSFQFSPQATTVNWTDIFDTSGLSIGYHQVGIRMKTEHEEWSHQQTRRFYIEDETDTTSPNSSNIIAAEYFFDDNDPGQGLATSINIGSPAELIALMDSINIGTGLADGSHTMNIRVQSDDRLWSAIAQDTFYLCNNTSPLALCQNQTIQLTTDGTALITANEIDNGSSAACGTLLYNLDQSDFDCTNVGENTVTLTVTDTNGNSSTCTATVTVQDNIPPVAICQDITVNLDVAGNASITAADIDNGSNDACGINSLSLDITSFNCTNIGVNTVTLTATDLNGNSSSCPSTVTVQDNLDPIPDVASLSDVTGQCTATVTAPTATDNCAGIITATTTDPTSFSSEGSYMINWIYDDGNGNSASQQQTVILDDMIAPVISCPSNMTIECSANNSPVNTGTATATDNCNNTPVITYADNNVGGSCMNTGTITRIWTATDASGNSSTCEQFIEVVDTSLPTASCQNITIQLDANNTATITANDINDGSSDSCGIPNLTISNGQTSFTCDDTNQTYLATLMATDACGNSNTCTATVIVADSTFPCCDISISNINTTTEACSNTAGMITVSATCQSCINGLNDIRYSIDGTNYLDNGGEFFNLPAGSYMVTVRDVNHITCSYSQEVVVSGAPLIVNTVVYAPISCNGAADGGVTSTVSGGTHPFTYLWSNGSPFVNTIFVSTEPYSLTVTDANGCTAISTGVLTEPEALSLTLNAQAESCLENDGEATVTPTGGTAPFTYTWGQGTGNQTTATAIGLAEGDYMVTVLDDNNCAAITTVTVSYDCINNCPPDYENTNQLTGQQAIDGTYETDGSIDSDQSIINNTKVIYDSATDIELLPGFEVQLGVEFDAFIDGCSTGAIQEENNDNQ